MNEPSVDSKERALADDLGQIYRRHRQGLFTLALSVTGNAEQAEDAVHDAVARLCRRERLDVDDPAAYLFRSVRNAALDQVRKRRTRLRSAESIFEHTLADPDRQDATPVERQEIADRIQQALQTLPEIQRQIVIMKIYGELTFRQIAQALDQPLSTVASRYQKALLALREPMESLV